MRDSRPRAIWTPRAREDPTGRDVRRERGGRRVRVALGEPFAERLDPLTVRRIKALDLAPGARCLEVGGGRGSIARWLCEYVGPTGLVMATDLETGFLSELSLPNLDVLRHDVTSGPGSISPGT